MIKNCLILRYAIRLDKILIYKSTRMVKSQDLATTKPLIWFWDYRKTMSKSLLDFHLSHKHLQSMDRHHDKLPV